MTTSSLNLTDKQELIFLAELIADLRSATPQAEALLIGVVRSALEPEIDPEGPLRLIGDLKTTDLERARQLLLAFLAGFKGEQSP